MAQPQPAVTPASAKSLFLADRAIKPYQFSQLKFFAILVGASVASLDNAKRVSQVFDALKGKYDSKEAAALLQSMLSVIDVEKTAVAGLASKEEDLEASTKVVGFKFGKLMITICQGIGESTFPHLRDQFKPELGPGVDKIASIDELLLKLIRAEKISPQNLTKLRDKLEDVGQDILATKTGEFRREVTGDIAQATDDVNGQDKEGFRKMMMVGLPGQTQPRAQDGLLHRPVEANDDGPNDDDEEIDHAGGNHDQLPNENQPPNDNQPHHDGNKTKSPYKRDFVQQTLKMKTVPFLKVHNYDANVTEHKSVDTKPVKRPETLVGVYPMMKREHGLALIISNELFGDRFERRVGTTVDEDNLIETFRFLGYRTKLEQNCTNAQIRSHIEDISKGNGIKKEDDSFVCCILTHGDDNYIYGTDGCEPSPGVERKAVVLRTENNSLEMKMKECEKLAGKPKLFFCSCCRGSTRGDKWAGPMNDGPSRKIPKRGDFAFYFSTLTGEPSTRYRDRGTVYVNALCHRLCEHATHATLSDIQKMVAAEVSQRGLENQVPCSEEQLFQNVYFFEDVATKIDERTNT